MIPDDFEYLFESNGYEFYAIEEYGFSHKKLAKQHKLYEKFGHDLSSTFYEIYTVNLYEQNKLSQIWIFKDEKPVGISIGLHYDNFTTVSDPSTGLKGSILGQIHLFTLPEHRSKGLASKTVPLLETMLMNKSPYPPCLILQDNAYPFAKFLEKTWGVPSNEGYGICPENKDALGQHYKILMTDNIRFKKLLKKFPKVEESYNQWQDLKLKMQPILSDLFPNNKESPTRKLGL